MILLPIVARELRVASRRAATYWTRFTAGFLAIVIGSIVGEKCWAFGEKHGSATDVITTLIT